MLTDTVIKATRYQTKKACDEASWFLPSSLAYYHLKQEGKYLLLAEHHDGGFAGFINVPQTQRTTKDYAEMVSTYLEETGINLDFTPEFTHDGFTIVNPYRSSCGRFEVNPRVEYGMNKFVSWLEEVIWLWKEMYDVHLIIDTGE